MSSTVTVPGLSSESQDKWPGSGIPTRRGETPDTRAFVPAFTRNLTEALVPPLVVPCALAALLPITVGLSPSPGSGLSVGDTNYQGPSPSWTTPGVGGRGRGVAWWSTGVAGVVSSMQGTSAHSHIRSK